MNFLTALRTFLLLAHMFQGDFWDSAFSGGFTLLIGTTTLVSLSKLGTDLVSLSVVRPGAAWLPRTLSLCSAWWIVTWLRWLCRQHCVEMGYNILVHIVSSYLDWCLLGSARVDFPRQLRLAFSLVLQPVEASITHYALLTWTAAQRMLAVPLILAIFVAALVIFAIFAFVNFRRQSAVLHQRAAQSKSFWEWVGTHTDVQRTMFRVSLIHCATGRWIRGRQTVHRPIPRTSGVPPPPPRVSFTPISPRKITLAVQLQFFLAVTFCLVVLSFCNQFSTKPTAPCIISATMAWNETLPVTKMLPLLPSLNKFPGFRATQPVYLLTNDTYFSHPQYHQFQSVVSKPANFLSIRDISDDSHNAFLHDKSYFVMVIFALVAYFTGSPLRRDAKVSVTSAEYTHLNSGAKTRSSTSRYFASDAGSPVRNAEGHAHHVVSPGFDDTSHKPDAGQDRGLREPDTGLSSCSDDAGDLSTDRWDAHGLATRPSCAELFPHQHSDSTDQMGDSVSIGTDNATAWGTGFDQGGHGPGAAPTPSVCLDPGKPATSKAGAEDLGGFAGYSSPIACVMDPMPVMIWSPTMLVILAMMTSLIQLSSAVVAADALMIVVFFFLHILLRSVPLFPGFISAIIPAAVSAIYTYPDIMTRAVSITCSIIVMILFLRMCPRSAPSTLEFIAIIIPAAVSVLEPAFQLCP